MTKLHPQLAHQLSQLGLDDIVPPSPAQWTRFLAALDGVYRVTDRARNDMDESVELFEREMRDTNDKLEVERDRMRQMFELAPIGIMRVELDGRVSMVNPGMQRMVGYEEADFTEPGAVLNLMHPEDRAAATKASKAYADRPRAYTAERRFVHKDGTTVYTKVAVSVAQDPDQRPLFTIVVVEDISERIRLEMELRHAQKLESVGRLASGIAHELNTPIQFIGDNTSFLKSAHEDLLGLCDAYRQMFESMRDMLPEEQRAVLSRALEAADLEYIRTHAGPAFAATMDGVGRVATIVKAMKAFAHPDQGMKSPADINAALRSTLIVVANELKYVAEVEVAFAELEPVECYLSDLNQVFLNLLVNAAHAVGDVVRRSGGKGKIFVSTVREGDTIVIAVRDTGCGIPEEIRNKVFDPFFTTKEVGRGTGQGLAISRSVVEKHGGTLTFETEVGRGTTFFVRLPALSQAREVAPTAAVAAA